MSKKCKLISFPHSDQFKSIPVCIGYYHLNHIIDEHIGQNTELWAKRTNMNQSCIEKFRESSPSRPSNHILHSNLAKILFETIQWSAGFPIYIKLTQIISKTNQSKTRNSKIFIFMAQTGYIVFTSARPARLSIETAFFPKVPNKIDSNYQVFSRNMAHLKRNYYKNKVIIDSKHEQTRKITDCTFVNKKRWQRVPTIEEFFGV